MSLASTIRAAAPHTPQSVAQAFNSRSNSIGFLRWLMAFMVIFSHAGPIAGFYGGEDLGVQLFEGDLHPTGGIARLEEEGPLARGADGAQDEALGGIELDDGHGVDPSPAPPPTAASPVAGVSCVGFGGRSTAEPVSLVRSTIGRVEV